MANNLESQWFTVTKDLPKPVSEWWWSLILKKYSETGREAHNVAYLDTKLQELLSFRHSLTALNAFIFALFFQYFNYDPRDADFYLRNIESFEKFALEAGLAEQDDTYQKVKHLLEASSIYSTEEHKIEGAYGEEDIHYFLDLDMFALGRNAEEYSQHSKDISMEYTFLNPDAYKNLRRKVLQSFLLIPNIFATRLFREKYEENARQNIQRELEGLRS